jgi:tRNA (mo5U34)-methyltransferase
MRISQEMRARLSRAMPRGRVFRIGGLRAQRRWDGLLVGPTAAHPSYGDAYQLEKLPDGLSPEELRQYAGRIGWYHEIDLGNDVLTAGMKSAADIEREWKVFALGDLSGKSVLDIGGIDGAYAFWAERHGAGPVAVLDHYLWATDAARYAAMYEAHVDADLVPPAPHESDAWFPETTPSRWRFDLARQAMRSNVQAIPLDFASCDLAEVGRWDFVLYLGVLYHMSDPVGALRRVAEVTRHQAIVETEAMFIRGHPEALWRFFPSGELNNDRSNWWVPNMNALLGLIGAAGFANAEILAGEPADDDHSDDGPHHFRAIVRAIK